MVIKTLREGLKEFLDDRGLVKKWLKAKRLFEKNIRHPSLHTELMEPKWRGIYSFRLDNKYRALLFMAQGKAEVFQISDHYKK